DVLRLIVVVTETDGSIGKVGQRKYPQHGLTQRAEAVRRNDVAGEAPRSTGCRTTRTGSQRIFDVDDATAGIETLREIAVPLGLGRHRDPNDIARFVGAPIFATQEEKPFVADATRPSDWTAERAASSVVAKNRLRQIIQNVEVVVRVQRLVSQEVG